MSRHVPGSAGLPIFGDKSYEFYKNPISFVEEHMKKYGSRIFMSRLLNKPTVFVGSNEDARKLLKEHGQCIELGYRSFMHDVLGENILFVDGEASLRFRRILMNVLSHESFLNFEDIVDECVERSFISVPLGKSTCAYTFFKAMSTEICLSVFLGLDFSASSKLATDIIHLTTEHWHGIISVPLSLHIPFMNSSSTFTKALEAKGKLLEIIDAKIHENAGKFPELVRNSFGDLPEARNHLLLFTSALVPKALASLLTSFVLSTAGRKDLIDGCIKDPSVLDNVLLEVQRLWPPFIGGRRIIRKSFSIGKYRLDKGHAILYVTHAAHRDPAIFSQPDEFRPERWSQENCDDKNKLLSFGLGHRSCIGQKFIMDILKHIIRPLCERYYWELSAPGHSIEHKWLPVSRPLDGAMIKLTLKNLPAT